MKDYVAMVFLALAVFVMAWAVKTSVSHNEPCYQRTTIEVPVCR